MTLLSGILYAQEVAEKAAPGTTKAVGNGSFNVRDLIPFGLIAFVFYFLIIRPQQKKEKSRKELVNSIGVGDRVRTAGGIYGTVSSIKEDQNIYVIKVSENSKIEFAKSAIQTKITPNSEDGKK